MTLKVSHLSETLRGSYDFLNQISNFISGDLGPVSVNFNARDMKDYAGGIYNNPSCSKTLTHFALAVGYGSSGDHEYWIVKNSWGTTWGDKGYIKMTRNKDNQCGIASSAFFVYFRR